MRAASLELIEFAIEVAELQTRGGRHFSFGKSKAVFGMEAAPFAGVPEQTWCFVSGS